MKQPLFLIAYLLFISFTLKGQNTCSNLPKVWKSEKEAIERIENTKFLSEESFNASFDSWMISAHYYMCNEETGYLIIKGDKKEIIHQEVPVGVWKYLKEARSKGGYYNFYVRQRFRLVMNSDS